MSIRSEVSGKNSDYRPFHGLLQSFVINRIVQSPHENHFIVCRQHKAKWGLMKMMIYVSSSRNHANILFKLRNQMKGAKTKSYFWSLEIIKRIHAPTSRDCYFYQLKFLKNFNYVSVNSKPDPPPSGRPPEIRHVPTAQRVGFSPNFLSPGIGGFELEKFST